MGFRYRRKKPKTPAKKPTLLMSFSCIPSNPGKKGRTKRQGLVSKITVTSQTLPESKKKNSKKFKHGAQWNPFKKLQFPKVRKFSRGSAGRLRKCGKFEKRKRSTMWGKNVFEAQPQRSKSQTLGHINFRKKKRVSTLDGGVKTPGRLKGGGGGCKTLPRGGFCQLRRVQEGKKLLKKPKNQGRKSGASAGDFVGWTIGRKRKSPKKEAWRKERGSGEKKP